VILNMIRRDGWSGWYEVDAVAEGGSSLVWSGVRANIL